MGGGFKVLVWFVALGAQAGEVRPGVWVERGYAELPLPVAGYGAYLVGEVHGLERNAGFQLHYLERLRAAAGVRDVVIEEDSVYQRDAQAFVAGSRDALPPELCLRADVLQGIRVLNRRLAPADRIRVHLADIDSPATAIHQHLRMLKEQLGANEVVLPPPGEVVAKGAAVVEQLQRLAVPPAAQAELRTIRLSLEALAQGFEVGILESRGSPYLDSREQAITMNIADLAASGRPLLVLYGADHVARSPRRDGGPNRDQPFQPMALRLKELGISAYSLVTFPLGGARQWRGNRMTLPWSAADGHLSTGETFEALLKQGPTNASVFIDRKREASRLPSLDISRMDVDAYVLFDTTPAMQNRCQAPAR
jgi:hypothetical protein